MLFKIITVYSENHMKPINSLCGQNAGQMIVKADCTFHYHWALKGYVSFYLITATQAVKVLGHNIITVLKSSSSLSKHCAYWFSASRIVRKEYLEHTYVDYAYSTLLITMMMVMITQKQNVN
jgi:hypothetical protein